MYKKKAKAMRYALLDSKEYGKNRALFNDQDFKYQQFQMTETKFPSHNHDVSYIQLYDSDLSVSMEQDNNQFNQHLKQANTLPYNPYRSQMPSSNSQLKNPPQMRGKIRKNKNHQSLNTPVQSQYVPQASQSSYMPDSSQVRPFPQQMMSCLPQPQTFNPYEHYKTLQKSKNQIQQKPVQKSSKIPQVQTRCLTCGAGQLIPGTSHQYCCYQCQRVHKVQPKWGFFICGHCRVKVCYLIRSSDYIRCRKCNTVNFVQTKKGGQKEVQEKKEVSPQEMNYKKVQEEQPFEASLSQVPAIRDSVQYPQIQ